MTYLAKIPLVRSGKTVLVVEDNPHLRFGMVAALRAAGHDVAEGDTCAALRERFLQSRPDAVVTDLRLPDGDAMDLLPSLRRLDPTIPLIVVTGFGTIDIAVTAVKSGAEDFLTKPVDMAKLVSLVDQVIARRTTSRSSKLLLGARPTPSASPLMRSLEDQVERLRDADCSVLILGETGTGKSVLARRIHEIGSRGSGPFIDVNCAGLTPELVENELFGHGRGAYTGAHAEKVGLFDAANRGTLFLDEIGDVDPMVQPKILKVLEEKRFRRMGEVKEREVDVRLVAATHKPLLAAVEEKQFRADLYYRISTVTLVVPALRQRPEDIPLLARDIIAARGGADVTIEPAAEERLLAYRWPGNIRELANVLERALLLRSGDVIRADDLHLEAASTPRATPAAPASSSTMLAFDASRSTRDEIEREHIRLALVAANGRVEAAAKRLGIPRSTLYQRLKHYRIEVRDFRARSGRTTEDEGH